MDAITAALIDAHGTIVINAGSVSMCANGDGEWVVYTNYSPPKLLYRGTNQDTAVKCLITGQEAE